MACPPTPKATDYATLIFSTTIQGGGESSNQVPYVVTTSVTSTSHTAKFHAACPGANTLGTTSLLSKPQPECSSASYPAHASGSPASLVLMAPDQSSLQARAQDSGGGSGNSWLGPMLGGVLGGFFGLLLLVGIMWCLWTRRCNLCCRRELADELEAPPAAPAPAPRPPAPQPVPQPEPKPYQYGQVGRPPSQLSWASSPPPSQSPPPGSPPPESEHHSMSVLTGYTPPPSAYGHASGTWTPPTALTPGLSIPSSSRPPSALIGPPGRQSWPRLGGSDDSHDEMGQLHRPLSERRPSRLSLTLANWNPETDRAD